MISTLLAILYTRAKLAARRTYNLKVTRLVYISIRRLSQYAATHPSNPFIAVTHLRDQILQREFSAKKRKELWDGVEKVVEMNSNVRAAEREIEGEPMRVWSWIGGKFVDDGTEDELELEGVQGVKRESGGAPEAEEKVHWNKRRRAVM